MGSPVTSRRKVAEKGSVAWSEETVQWSCVSHDGPQRESILREDGKSGSNHTVRFSKATMCRAIILEKKDQSQGIIRKERTSGAKSTGSQIRGKNASRNPEKRSGAPAKTPGIWLRMFPHSKRSQKIRSTFLPKLG